MSIVPHPVSFYNEAMGLTFRQIPELFGYVHILSLLLIVTGNLFFYVKVKSYEEDRLLKILHHTGLIMMILEVFKQIYCYFYVFDKTINLWFFPWQLCSMAMYCAFFCIYLKEDKQNVLLVFMASFSLFADIVALLAPLDMLRIQVLLTIHSFVYHGLIISCSLLSLLLLKKRKDLSFPSSVMLFLAMAFIAQIINVMSHQLLHDIRLEPDMFYITPYYPSTQPVFHEIAVQYGIFTEIVLYLVSIIFVSYFFYILERKYFLSRDQ